jgi:hypothetical protein
MKFRKRPIVVEANQYTKRSELVQGLRSREDGTAFVVTMHGDQLDVQLGDWVILEQHGCGTLAYPCKPDVFAETYEVYVEPPAPRFETFIRREWWHLVKCRRRAEQLQYMGQPVREMMRDELLGALQQITDLYEQTLRH